MSIMDNKLNTAWWALRISFGVVPFLAGLDKFFNLLTNWQMYINPSIAHLLPVSGTTFMHIVGVIEMIVGLAILTRWTRLGSYVAMIWLTLIALTLVLGGMFLDVAVRDLVMAVGVYTLAQLTEARQSVTETQRGHAPQGVLAR
ncbi:MAG TPA: hypothetical protein VLR90_07115 [Blastocatellia bacterium]|nr:hypothetical protein [Blastocatellia bacterium]